MAVELPNFIVLIRNPEKTVMGLIVTKEASEGSKQKCTTSLSLIKIGGSV